MILVFIMLGIIIFICFFSFLILLSSIQIDINKLCIVYLQHKWKTKFVISVSLLIFHKIKIFSVKINDLKIKKWIKNKKMNISNLRKKQILNLQNYKLLKELKWYVQKFCLKGYFSTLDPVVTSSFYSIVQVSIPIIIAKSLKGKYENKLYFLNDYENRVNIQLSCIFSLKMVNIIYIIKELKKKGRKEKNGKSSNRKPYAYSYE